MELREFREVLETGWRMLDEAVAGMDEAALAAPGVVEAWSAKDLLGHVAAWEHQALRLLRQRAAGEPLDAVHGSAADSYNADESQRRAALPLADVRAELAETRRELRERLAALAEDEWGAVVDAESGARVGDWVGGVTGGPLGPGTHPAEHAHHILLARVARGMRRSTRANGVAGAGRAARGFRNAPDVRRRCCHPRAAARAGAKAAMVTR